MKLSCPAVDDFYFLLLRSDCILERGYIAGFIPLPVFGTSLQDIPGGHSKRDVGTVCFERAKSLSTSLFVSPASLSVTNNYRPYSTTAD